jgi:hypothetical protein
MSGISPRSVGLRQYARRSLLFCSVLPKAGKIGVCNQFGPDILQCEVLEATRRTCVIARLLQS